MKKNDRKKKKQRKGGAQSGQTFMKLSRGLRSGSVQIKRYSKELAHRFNDYTQGKSDEKQEARFRSRLDRLFSRLHLDILRGHGFVAFLLALAILLAAMLLLMNNSDIAVDKATLEQFTLEDWIVQAEELGATYLDTSTAIKVGASTLWLTPASLLNVNASETLSRLGAQVTLETQEVQSRVYHPISLIQLDYLPEGPVREMLSAYAVLQERLGDLGLISA